MGTNTGPLTEKGFSLTANPPAKKIFALPDPPHPSRIAECDGETAESVLILDSFLSRTGKVAGPVRHSFFRSLPAPDVREETLRTWISDAVGGQVSAKAWDLCRKEAEMSRRAGIRIFRYFGLGHWETNTFDGREIESPTTSPRRKPGPSRICKEDFLVSDFRRNDVLGQPPRVAGSTTLKVEVGSSHCRPAVLFSRGDPVFDLPWLAMFNSRKPRLFSHEAAWLEALRYSFAGFNGEKFVVASSSGTLTYDLACAHALRSKLPLVLVAQHSVLDQSTLGEYTAGVPVLSCLLDASACPKDRKQFCRDRILAGLSHVQLVLELRPGGNLATVLEERQRVEPGLQFVFEPARKNPSNAGNFRLLDLFPAHARPFRVSQSARSVEKGAKSAGEVLPAHIDWRRFLYHYTRACPGPWPGEEYLEYLGKLLDGDPRSGHSALDTLIRIAAEKRVRASAGLVRGREPVVSLSAHSPPDFFRLRAWNTTLSRWTVEPYGIAVSRDYLKSLGAMPAVYGSDAIYSRLPESGKYRFQLNVRDRSAWKYEREWRLRGGIDFSEVKDGDCFLFVPTADEKEKLLSITGAGLPVIALDEIQP